MPVASCNVSDCFLCRFCVAEWKLAIAPHKRNIAFKKGKAIFREGEPVAGMFFVFSGSVKIHKRWAEGKDIILQFAKKGELVGHRGLLNTSYPVSATAIEDTVLCFVPTDFLEASLKANPGLTYELMHFYAVELQRAEKRMRNLAHMEVKGRIADALIQIEAVYGSAADGFVNTEITRQDIASYAGSTYETVFKFFIELNGAGIVSTAGKRFRINDREALTRFMRSKDEAG